MPVRFENEIAPSVYKPPLTGERGYSPTAKVLHWLMAFIIFLNAGLGWSLDGDGLTSNPNVLLIHFAFGTLLLTLLILRIAWWKRNAPPQLPSSISAYQRKAAQVMHFGFYVLMAVVPLSGLWMGLVHEELLHFVAMAGLEILQPEDHSFQSRKALHSLTVNLLLAGALFHIAAALHHQFWLKDKLLVRMTWGGKHNE